ncbi:MAG TPA: FecR domain-containing protein [Prolixibacteraceae bacterium]|nr:FecR domain-containing protein [Prolixibacteraceae bacterium]
MQENIHLLMTGYLSGNLSESEQLELKNHLELNHIDRKIFEDYCLLWKESGQKTDARPIDIESDLKKTKIRLFPRRSNIFNILQRVAAVFILAGVFSAAYIHYYTSVPLSAKIEQPVMMQEVSAIFGTRSKFELPDGTTVYLNSGSKLIFPTRFNDNTRKVELVGEAFFEVTSNPAKPFIVKTSEINVKVLGTAFNLQAYPDSKEISTTLVHGKVILETESAGISKQVAELKPSDHAVFHTKDKAINISAEEDLDKFIGWKDGKLVFFNDPIENVSDKLGNWYNVNVKIHNAELKKYRFTATFTDEPIEQVLDLLSKSSPIRYRIKQAARLSDNSYSKREIIIN